MSVFVCLFRTPLANRTPSWSSSKKEMMENGSWCTEQRCWKAQFDDDDDDISTKRFTNCCVCILCFSVCLVFCVLCVCVRAHVQVVKNNLNPSWKKFSVPLQTFCSSDLERPLKVPTKWELHFGRSSHLLFTRLDLLFVALRWIVPTTTATARTTSSALSPPTCRSCRKLPPGHRSAGRVGRRTARVYRHLICVLFALCPSGGIWLHPSGQAEEEEELQKLRGGLCEKLQGTTDWFTLTMMRYDSP